MAALTRVVSVCALLCITLAKVGAGRIPGTLQVVAVDGGELDDVVGAGVQGITQARYALGQAVVEFEMKQVVVLGEADLRTFMESVSRAKTWTRFTPDRGLAEKYRGKIVLFDEQVRAKVLSDTVYEPELSESEYLWQTTISLCHQFENSTLIKVQPSSRWIGWGAYFHASKWFQSPGKAWWRMFEPQVNISRCTLFESYELHPNDRLVLFQSIRDDGYGIATVFANMTSVVNPYHEYFSKIYVQVAFRGLIPILFLWVAGASFWTLHFRYVHRNSLKTKPVHVMILATVFVQSLVLAFFFIADGWVSGGLSFLGQNFFRGGFFLSSLSITVLVTEIFHKLLYPRMSKWKSGRLYLLAGLGFVGEVLVSLSLTHVWLTGSTVIQRVLPAVAALGALAFGVVLIFSTEKVRRRLIKLQEGAFVSDGTASENTEKRKLARTSENAAKRKLTRIVLFYAVLVCSATALTLWMATSDFYFQSPSNFCFSNICNSFMWFLLKYVQRYLCHPTKAAMQRARCVDASRNGSSARSWFHGASINAVHDRGSPTHRIDNVKLGK